MDEIQALNKKRGTLKARITTFKKFLTHIVEANPDEAQALDDEVQEQLRQRISRIKDTLSEFEDIQGDIEERSDNTELNIEVRESFEKNYYEALALASKLLRRGVLQAQHNDELEAFRRGGRANGAGRA